MYKKKNGFIATALIYPFYLTILLMLTFLLNSYSRVAFDLWEIEKEIRDEDPGIEEDSLYADINVFVYARESVSDDYLQRDHLPGRNYTFDKGSCYKIDGSDDPNSKVTYDGTNVTVKAKNKTVCKVYFTKQEKEADVILNVWVNDIDAEDVNYNLMDALPTNINNYKYVSDKTYCTDASNNKLSSDVIKPVNSTDLSKGFTIEATQRTICNVYFTKK